LRAAPKLEQLKQFHNGRSCFLSANVSRIEQSFGRMFKIVHFIVDPVEIRVLPIGKVGPHAFEKGRFVLATSFVSRNNLQAAMIRRCNPKEGAVEVKPSQPFAGRSHCALSNIFSSLDYRWNLNRPTPFFKIVMFRKNERVQDTKKVIERRYEEMAFLGTWGPEQPKNPSAVIRQFLVPWISQVQPQK
jgi:hypothetical protein